MTTALITDHPWSDVKIEREIVDAAGLRLVAGSTQPQPAAVRQA